ncbi:ribosome-binding factor A [Amylibacter ulvae]|uniref:Ribosome-binding factor A n=1 Tax=Paramylibacter ulvae TaxID=1651968 RepID=A0ABQ3D7B3_9RHOB|nr:30S ribosome-binding factor RbfA [Amylibacter ulvae]GHA59869.1 ribosome-binding factor A [Amylibacter ulvae]
MAKRNDFSPEGPSQRQLRVGELIRRAVAETLQRGDIHDPELAHVSITVGEVRPTPDLKTAIVFVLPLGGINAEAVIAALNRNTYEIRRAMNKAVTLKFSPKLKFVLDTTFDNLDETRRLLSQDKVVKDIATDDE